MVKPVTQGTISVRMALLGALMLFMAGTALPMGPPRSGELEKYRKDGSLSRRIAFAEKTGNFRVSPDLARRKIAQLRAQQAGQRPTLATFPYKTGLPSKGTPRIFALLIDFSDYPHLASNNEDLIRLKLFGAGKPAEKPYESLAQYYMRSSYGALQLQGDVLPWYRAKNSRSTYGSAEAVVKEALEAYKDKYDFTVYDNNQDGIIDYFIVFYSGPDTGWGTLWWYWCGYFDGDNLLNYKIDGKRPGTFSFQWEANPVGSEYSPHPVIHETGHGLGLADYYDYKEAIGPKGGCGGLDMMDHNWGDHNSFSKWLLDWISPTVIGASSGAIQTIRLSPASLYNNNAVIIMPGASLSTPFSEFYMVQNRSRGQKGGKRPARPATIAIIPMTAF